MFLGLNLVLLCVNYLLLFSLNWNCRGLCKQTAIEIFNQCNFHFSFSFFQRKRKVVAGILTVQEKNKLCGIWGEELCHINTKIMQECVIL